MTADTSEPQLSIQLPKYQRRTRVHALKITRTALKPEQPATAEQEATKALAVLYPEDERYSPFTVPYGWFERHSVQAPGYYVVYEDGYRSWSPVKAFEEGYTRI